jgi:TetR/AcrR family transcriptional regulator, transcriptional repressor for nem operon
METRDKILTAMFLDMRKNGFQGLRADKVIADLNVTKGALYHHFAGKEAIGLAVISELLTPNYLSFYQDLDIFYGNPIDMLQFHLKDLSRKATDEDITLGCPLNNLVQEMTPINEQFRLNLKQLVDKMQNSVADALRRGQKKGFVKTDIDPEAIAHFYYAGIEGSYGAAKVHKSAIMFQSNMQQLALYLDILRGS